MSRNKWLPSIDPERVSMARDMVIYQDDAVIVFNKPSGLPVQGGGGIDLSLDLLLTAFAKSNGKTPRLVHRLDRGTSGVVIAARTKPAAAFLSEEFAARRAKKTYLALVRGNLPGQDSGIIANQLAKVEEGGRPRMIVAKPGRKGAQAAETHWRILTRAQDAALMELKPVTGRMHQLRVHLMSLGCPIIGDHLYGRADADAGRLMLHALSLDILHPTHNEHRLYTAPVPDEMTVYARAIGIEISKT